jgi:hypothetical protein
MHPGMKTDKKGDPVMTRPLRENPYFRAGIMGLPFCIVMGYIRREPIFLLGGGFFASFLFSTLFEYWRTEKKRKAQSGNGSNNPDTDRQGG